MAGTFKIVMFSTTNIQSFASLAAEINRRYGEYRGYEFVHEQYDHLTLPPSYEKLKVLRKHLGTADYLLWLDSDACVINFSQSLEEFCESGKDFIIAGHQYGFDLTGRRTRYYFNDLPAGLNCGVMLLRSCDWTGEFLDYWWSRCETAHAEGVPFLEQGPLQQLLVENARDFHSHIHLVTPCSRLNRCDDDNTDVCDFVLHLWGLGADHRERIFSQVLSGVRPDTHVELPKFFVPTR